MSPTPRRFDARRTYNRIGRLQDTQAFYERGPVNDLIAHLGLGDAHHVLEIGCGTGKLAHRLLREELGAGATYTATEVSDHMAELATTRLAEFDDRASVVLVDPDVPLPEEPAVPDRIIATYVFDLLAITDTNRLLTEIERRLAPGGLVGIASLSAGAGGVSRLISTAWTALWRRAPAVVGGCRPVDLEPQIVQAGFDIRHINTETAWGVTSQVIVAGAGGGRDQADERASRRVADAGTS